MILHIVRCDNCPEKVDLIPDLLHGSHRTPPSFISFEGYDFCSYNCLGVYVAARSRGNGETQ